MEKEKREEAEKLVKIILQLDKQGILVVKSGADALLIRQMLDKDSEQNVEGARTERATIKI